MRFAQYMTPALLLIAVQARAISQEELFDLPLESLLDLPVSIASPFQENVADAASSVAVLQPEDWQRRAARSVEEALEQVPGTVSYYSLGGARMTAVRGYATELSSRGVAMLLDGVPLNNFSYGTAIYDAPFHPLPLLNRIEMIRGPGSTLYGSDAFHGVIALHTPGAGTPQPLQHVAAAGTDDLGEFALAGSGRHGRWRNNAGVAWTHHGNQQREYDYTEPFTGNMASGTRDDHVHNGAGFVHLETGNAREADGLWRLSFYGDTYESRGFPGIGRQFYQPLQANFQLQSLNLGRDRDRIGQDSTFWLAHLEHVRPVGETYELNVSAYEWRGEQTWILDLSRYPLTLTTTGNTVLPCRTSPAQTGVSPLYCPHTLYQGTADRRHGMDLLLRAARGPGNTEWAVGVGRDLLTVLDAPLQRTGLLGEAYVNETSPFAGANRHIDHAQFHARSHYMDDRLNLSYGLRWDDYSDGRSATSPRLGVIWKFTPAWSGKALYGHAFRAPTAAESAGGGAGSFQLPNPDIKPETIDTGELVAQYQAAGHNSTITAFYSRWEDGIVLNPLGPSQNQYQNTGASHAYGVELGHQRQRGSWRMEANTTWTYSVNDHAPLASGGYGSQEYSAFPAWLLNLGVGRSFAGGWELWLNERAMFDYAESDAIAGRSAPRAPDYWRTDLHLQKQTARSRIWLDLRNLFDRDNIVPALYNAEGGLPDEGFSLRLGIQWSLDRASQP